MPAQNCDRTTPSQRVLNLVRDRIGTREAELFQAGVMDPGWDVTDDFRELAMELKGVLPARGSFLR